MPKSQAQDKVTWGPESDGKFSVKSCYKVISQHLRDEDVQPWSNFWQCKLPPKVKTFLWQACTNSLPTKDLLIQRKVNCGDRCSLCSDGEESIFHIFVSCKYAKACWNLVGVRPLPRNINCFNDWLIHLASSITNYQVCIVYIICWKIWSMRNNIIWNNQTLDSAEATVRSARTYYKD